MSESDILCSSPSSPSSRAPELVDMPLKKLRPHPDRSRVWAAVNPKSADVQRLAEMYRRGEFVQFPVVAKVPGENCLVILDGALRVTGARAAGQRRMPVTVVRCTSMAHALTCMIEMNQSRPKVLLDQATEVYFCGRAQRKLAKERQRRAGGDRRSATAKGTVPAAPAGTDRGETRDLVAKITHQSREHVRLMIALIKKARKANPNNPRDTKIGRALARPDADLKAIAKEFKVIKEPSQTSKPSRGAPAATSRTTTTLGGAAPSGNAPRGKSSGGNAPSGSTGHNPKPAKVDSLASAVEYLAALEGAVEKIAASSTATTKKRTPRGALAWMLACSLDELTHRLRECVGDATFGAVRRGNKRGEARCRGDVRAWLEKADAHAQLAFTNELGQGGASLVQDLRAGNADLDREQLLLVLRAIVTSASTRP